MKRFFTLSICKAFGLMTKIAKTGGSSLPGQWSQRLDKNMLRKLAREIPKETVVVTGTNGKTTVNNMIEQILTKEGNRVVCNKLGANMSNGIITAYIEKTPLIGKVKADYATIEMDEIATDEMFDYMSPNYVVMTNLFRDQLDRYGEIDIIINRVKEAFAKLPKETVLILNGDDPLVAGFGHETDHRVIYYGIEETKGKINEKGDVKEGRFCGFCGHILDYSFYHYGQLGDYTCTHCGFKRPSIDYLGVKVDLSNGIQFTLKTETGEHEFDMDYEGFYNIYNILASVVVLQELGISLEKIETYLKNYQAQVGRMEVFHLTKPIFLNLSKNPAGFNQSIEIVENKMKTQKMDVLLALNDDVHDGKDVSWIWDTLFEKLNSPQVENYYFIGTRRYEMAIRLKYAGVPEEKIHVYDTVESGTEALLKGKGEIGFCLVNYTALFQIHKVLKEKERVITTI